MNNKQLSILIPDGESEFALPVLRCLSQIPDVKVYVLSSEPWSIIRLSKHRSEYFSHSAKESSEQKFEEIRDTVKRLEVDILLPVDVPTIELVARNKNKFDSIVALPPIASVESINIAADKGKLGELLKKNNLPSPRTVFFRDGEFDAQEISNLTFPVLIKPIDGVGGRGIKFFDTLLELKKYFSVENNPEKYVVQSFVKGYDMGCSVLCRGGEIIASTMQKALIEPFNEYAPPSGVQFFYDENVYDIIQKLMRELNWSGVANIDLRYDEIKGQALILEMNPRFWGSTVGSLVAGINFPYLACLLSMNMDIPRLEYKFSQFIHHKRAVFLFFQNLIPGRETYQRTRGTGVQFVLNDPLPEIFKYCVKIYNKVLGNKN